MEAPPTRSGPVDDTTLTPPTSLRPERPSREGSRFAEKLAEVEAHRTWVRATLAVALIARLLLEFRVPMLSGDRLLAEVPRLGLALLAYLIVLWFLAARTRDRFGFGMALGIGILQGTTSLVAGVVLRPWSVAAAWPPLLIGVAHVALAVVAFRSASAFPPYDGKRPWIVGGITALVFLAIPWLAPWVAEQM